MINGIYFKHVHFYDSFDLNHANLISLVLEFSKFMNEVENGDLVFILETIVDKFREEMHLMLLGFDRIWYCWPPFLFDFTHIFRSGWKLLFFINIQAAAIWRCMNTAEGKNEADDPRALAAVGCLRAISTILKSVAAGFLTFLSKLNQRWSL